MTDQKRPPITCHVLDTTLGKPGASIPVTLTLLTPHSTTSTSFAATTNADGRVTAWTPGSSAPFTSPPTLEQIWADEASGDLKWKLRFDTEAYFGQRGVAAFFPEVEVVFKVGKAQRGEHFHVPVLLGPFGYTTYRGS